MNVTGGFQNKEEQGLNTSTILTQNSHVLAAELAWLAEVVDVRIALYFHQETPVHDITDLHVPDLAESAGSYAAFVRKHNLKEAERLALILALVPHLKPAVLDILSTKNKDYDRRFSEFGGLFLEGHSGLIPTAETLLFILAGDDVTQRMEYHYLFRSDHVFARMRVIPQNTRKKATPYLSSTWMVTHEYVNYFINGELFHAEYSEDFPAQRITTQMEWEDIILAKRTADSLQEIRNWSEYSNVVMHDLGLSKRLKPGFKSLFFGPPGTGKSMAAALLGKSIGKPVYKVDLSMTVSKYVGETEKNLSKVFDQAQIYDWILFFDEADSLFGNRTQVSSANDRYGNQEIGYLLQRIEDFPGLVILASNLKDNIDDAFTRRFQSMIEFRMPGVKERYQLWQQSFSTQLPLDQDIDLWAMAERYELSGGMMMNVVRKCTLHAVTNKHSSISQKELEGAIRQELQKEGILLS